MEHVHEPARRGREIVIVQDSPAMDLYAALEADPDDRSTLAVLADQLQLAGDPRGELISVQLELDGVLPRVEQRLQTRGHDDVVRLTQRRTELVAQLAPPATVGKVTWGIGFVKRVELATATVEAVRAALAAFDHPSLAYVREVYISFEFVPPQVEWLVELVQRAPRSTRLEFSHCNVPDLQAARWIAELSQLRSLALATTWGVPELAHPTLRRVELAHVRRGERLFEASDPRGLPALHEVHFRDDRPLDSVQRQLEQNRREAPPDDVAVAEATMFWRSLARWWPQLTLVKARTVMTRDAYRAIVAALDGRRIARLDLRHAIVLDEITRAELAALCDELVLPATHVEPAAPAQRGVVEEWFEHAKQPAWGRGRVLRRFDDKIEIAFEHGGTRVFKADAPFLRAIE